MPMISSRRLAVSKCAKRLVKFHYAAAPRSTGISMAEIDAGKGVSLERASLGPAPVTI
jgi:hypothetical protein